MVVQQTVAVAAAAAAVAAVAVITAEMVVAITAGMVVARGWAWKAWPDPALLEGEMGTR